MNAYQQISTSISTYQQEPMHVNNYIQIWIEMNAYQQISTNQWISVNIITYIRKDPPASLYVNKCETQINKDQRQWTKRANINQCNYSNISEYLTQILGVGPDALPSEFVLCENYVKTHYMAAKHFQPSASNAGTTSWSVESININKYQYISIDVNTYQQIYSSINKYACISTDTNKYQYISTNISIFQHI